MKPILRPDEMALADRATIDAGTPAEVLMDRAGRAVARAAIRVAGGRNGRRALVVCGKGNNGGDGFVAARVLREEGLGVTCRATFDTAEAKGAPAHHLELMRAAGVVPRPFSPDLVEDEEFDVVVDAIFGTGFSGSPRGEAAEAIKALDGMPRVVAVDIPSGVDGATGRVEGGAIHAKVTVALAAQKLGMVLLPGASFVGEIEVADIGIDVAEWRHGEGGTSDRDAPYVEMVEAPDVAASLPDRPLGAHKRSSGSVAILAGSDDMRGAALLTSLGALRMGAGYTTLGTTSTVQGAAAPFAPELLCRDVSDSGVLGPKSLDRFDDVLERADALAVGPGLGDGEEQRALVERIVSEVDLPLVLDADALNVLGKDPQVLVERRHPCIATPHPAELGRLLGSSTDDIVADRIGAVTEAARRFPSSAVVLKGYRTLVAFGGGTAVLVVPVGGPELATAGTGDVLTGATASLLASGVPNRVAGAVAAFVHGVAGAVAASVGGAQGVLASDVAEALPAARMRIGATPQS